LQRKLQQVLSRHLSQNATILPRRGSQQISTLADKSKIVLECVNRRITYPGTQVADLGGDEAVSTQQLAIIELVGKQKLFLDSIDLAAQSGHAYQCPQAIPNPCCASTPGHSW
jgi:hypothetical protein